MKARCKWPYYSEYIKSVGAKSTVFRENKQEAIAKQEIEKEQEQNLRRQSEKSHS